MASGVPGEQRRLAGARLACAARATEGLRYSGAALEQVRNRPRSMVFVNRIKEIKALAAHLARRGLRVASLHGEHSQREREQAERAADAEEEVDENP